MADLIPRRLSYTTSSARDTAAETTPARPRASLAPTRIREAAIAPDARRSFNEAANVITESAPVMPVVISEMKQGAVKSKDF